MPIQTEIDLSEIDLSAADSSAKVEKFIETGRSFLIQHIPRTFLSIVRQIFFPCFPDGFFVHSL